MFENLKYRLAQYTALKSFKKVEEDEKEFNKFFSNSTKFLLIIPTVQEDVNNCLDFYHKLAEMNKNIKLLRIAPVKIADLNTTDIINLKETDFSRLNLPNKNFLKQLKSEKFDISIDLELNNNLIAGYLTKHSNAFYKVGFKKENSDLYYNFQVSKSTINSEISYRNLLNSLLMF